jgi:putative PIN family toxin of toxin-antitoxin system
MSAAPPRVVFDCVVFLQAMIAKHGPSGECVAWARDGRLALFISNPLLAELADVAMRPRLTRKYAALSASRVSAFIADIERHSVLAPNPPNAFALPRDPRDEPYTDLAIAVDAHYLVTWNERHLTYLMKRDTPEGRGFCRRYPNLKILDPPSLLADLRDVP